MKFSGTIQIDESLFGRRCKYHRGKDQGAKVWIFGMIEVDSNKLILYPVDNRSRELLIPLIKKHVTQGSTIYSDGWSSYLSLNDEGYQHFVVSHASDFKQVSY